MQKTRSTGYKSLNIKPDTYKAVKDFAGKIEKNSGAKMTDDLTVKALLKHNREKS